MENKVFVKIQPLRIENVLLSLFMNAVKEVLSVFNHFVELALEGFKLDFNYFRFHDVS